MTAHDTTLTPGGDHRGTGRGGAGRHPWPGLPLLALVALVPLLAACDSKAKEAKQQPAPPPPAVMVLEVLQRDTPIVREFVARTEAVPTVEVRARIQGVLEQVLFKEGSLVKQGQTLFTIQPDEYRAALQSARAQLSKAQADLEKAQDVVVVETAQANVDQKKADLGKAERDVNRFRPLAQAEAIPKQDLETAEAQQQAAAAAVRVVESQLRDTILSQKIAIEQARAAIEAAKASVTQAELNLSYTTLRAPVTGIISKLAVDKGNLVGKSEPTLLATVSAVDPIYVDFAIPEVDYLLLVKRIPELGRGVEAAPKRPPTLELLLADNSTFAQKGRPIFIDRAVDQKTGTIQVRAEFANPGLVLRPGQFGRVRALVEERANAVLVPQRAVQEVQGQKSVLVVGPGDKVALRTVTLAESVQDFFIVTRGVEPGERVIVEGIQKVRPGMQVKPEPEPPAGTKAAPPAGAPASETAPAGKTPGGG